MKVALIIIDGLGDEPIPDLGGRTPLESAFVPNIHYIASRGRVGRIRTTFPGFPIESMVCIMALLGYQPARFYPRGRSSFEALAKGIPLSTDDLVLRCNTVTADLERQVLTDFTADLISDSDARTLIGQIELPYQTWELYPGQSYRNVLILRRAVASAASLKCSEPHMNIGRPLAEIYPKAQSGEAALVAQQLTSFLADSQKQIARMSLPATCKANMLWVWSPACKPSWPTFKERTGLSAGLVGGLDFLHGIAMAARIHYDVVPGATGYIDTDYRAKAEYSLRYLDEFDLVITHINAADEEAHRHNHIGKIQAIEKIDELIVGPILRHLVTQQGNFRLVVCGDHATRCRDGKHTADPVPFAVFGPGVAASNVPHFCEKTCAAFDPTPALTFLSEIT